MLALRLHPAPRLSALPHFEQTDLLNKHKLTAATNTSKAQLAKAGSGCGFAAVSLLHVRMREKKGKAAGMCPEELALTSAGASVRAGQFKAKGDRTVSPLQVAALYQARSRQVPPAPAESNAIIFFSEATVGPWEGLHPRRKAAAFLCTTLTFSFSSFMLDFSVKENYSSYIGLHIQKMCLLLLI